MACKKCGRDISNDTLSIISPGNGTRVIHFCPNCNPEMIKQYAEANSRVLERLSTEAGVPARYRRPVPDEKVQDYILLAQKQEERGIFFLGDSGIGKTQQMIVCMHRHLASGLSCKYMNFSEFLCQVRADMKQYTSLRNQYLDAQALFIDDFDASNPYMFDFIFNLIDTLYRECRLVYMTGNALPTQDKLAMRIAALTYQIEMLRK